MTVESDRILFAQAIVLEANTKEIALPIDAAWG